MDIREPAVAGLFYPDNPLQLQQDIDTLLHDADTPYAVQQPLLALVVPHAGYVYSGPVAATAYKLLGREKQRIRRVVLLGPSHRVALFGMAIPTVEKFRTPLGDVTLDCDALKKIAGLEGVATRDDAHALEHSLEVQLPFLQTVLEDFTLVPVVVGQADAEQVRAVMETLWSPGDTLILVSSDLSHFLPYATAQAADRQTTRQIENCEPSLQGEQACGCYSLNGLLLLASQRGYRVVTLDQRNSGDTAGNKDQVVGYGSYAVYQ